MPRGLPRGSLPDIDYKYKNRYRPSYEYYLRVDSPVDCADLVIDNRSYHSPEVVYDRMNIFGNVDVVNRSRSPL